MADHTFSMAVIGMIISDLENLDSEKVLKMILLHDLAESKIGDIVPITAIENVWSATDSGLSNESLSTHPWREMFLD